MDAQVFLQSGYRYVVVGATTNEQKYGYRVLQDLHGAGFQVVGVNPKYKEIAGIPCYPTLGELPWRPDVLVIVVPPAAGLQILVQAAKLSMEKIWFQPGAESEATAQLGKKLGLTLNDPGTCIMVARRLVGAT
jgi:hypothetical protein